MSNYLDLPDEVAVTLSDLENHYENFNAIDRGANGYLYFATNKISKMDVAIKFYAGEPGENRHDEPRQLSAITCDNVLPILEARSISEDWAFFVTPRCFEGDLDDIIKTNPCVYQALDLAIGICCGVSSIHAAGMIHRDLKPGNIVILNGAPRIADFGSVTALEVGHHDVGASRHSILWRPPESFETGRYSRKGDVYQIGIVVYQLLGGKLDYDGMEYLTKKQRKDFESIADPVEKSMYIDNVIKMMALTGKLIDIRSLPGWVDPHSRRAIKAICHHDVEKRLDSVADAAATLSSLRNRLSNWKWVGNAARLNKSNNIIELRATGNKDEYVAYKNSGVGFRRIPKLDAGSLAMLASKF